MKKKSAVIWSLVALVLLLDQTLKIYIKTHFTLGEAVHVFDWFQMTATILCQQKRCRPLISTRPLSAHGFL